MSQIQTVVYDAAELVIGPSVKDGPWDSNKEVETISNGALAIAQGDIIKVGTSEEVLREYDPSDAKNVIDASGKTVIPGFVDPHTHAAFAGDRSDEFALKLQGKSYQQILSEGGGILRTVEAVRDATISELVENLLSQLDIMLAHGTTTVEIKTGYGLDKETEIKLLNTIRQAKKKHPVDIVVTFMGAHAIPDGIGADEYVDDVVTEQLPAVAKHPIPEFCDVFCDEGAFTVSQSRRILAAGLDHGLKPKIHAEEFDHRGGAELAAELSAVSADHLLHATRADAEKMADAGVVPVLLPGTAFSLDVDYADPDRFVQAGCPVALATDLNPNCYSQSMQFTMALACNGMGMTPASAILGATRNAALAIDRPEGPGTIREGTVADAAILDIPSFIHIPYNFGVNNVDTVVKSGEIVHSS